MKIAHHPDSATLVTYAAGSLDEAFVMVVATHLASCAACRSRLREIEEIGGTLLESVDTIALNATTFERLMSQSASRCFLVLSPGWSLAGSMILLGRQWPLA
jgi:putative transcriptional regulator